MCAPNTSKTLCESFGVLGRFQWYLNIMDSAKYAKTMKLNKNTTKVFSTNKNFVSKSMSKSYFSHVEKESKKYQDLEKKKRVDEKRWRLCHKYFDGIESQGWSPFNINVSHQVDVSSRTEEIIENFKRDILQMFNSLSGNGAETFSCIRDSLSSTTRDALSSIEAFMSTLQHLFWIVPVSVMLVNIAMKAEWYETCLTLFGVLSLTFPASLSDFTEYVFSIFKTKKEQPESQAGFFSIDVITNLIGMGTTMLLFGPKDYLMWFNNIKNGLFQVANGLSEAEKMSDIIVKLIEGAINQVRQWFGKDKIVICKTGEKAIDDWAAKIALLTKNYKLCVTDMTPELVHSLQALRIEGYELDNMFRMDKRYNHSIRYYLTELDKICCANAAAFTAAKGVRVEPVSMCLYGPPGIGKTILANALSQIIMAEVLPVSRIQELDGLLAAEVFQKGSSEYWEGYAGQYTYVMDDFAQQVDVTGARDSDFMQLVRIVNSWQYPLNFATLENKGKNNFSSKLVVLTTNVSNLRLAASKVVADPTAVLRRIHNPYQLGVSEDWCAPGKRSFDKNALDTAKYSQYFEEKGKIPLQAWFVVPFDFSTGAQVVGERVSIEDFIASIVTQLSTKRQQFADTSKHIRTSVNEILARRMGEQDKDEFYDSVEEYPTITAQAGTFTDGFPWHQSMKILERKILDWQDDMKEALWSPITFCQKNPIVAALVGTSSLAVFGYFAKHAINMVMKLFEPQSAKNNIESETIDLSILENLNARVELPTASQVKITKNMYQFVAINLTSKKYVKLGHITGICGKTFIMPLHFKDTLRSKVLDVAGPEDDLQIKLVNAVKPSLIFEMPLQQFLSLDFMDMENMDVCFVKLPVVASCADISLKFLTKAELKITSNGISCALYGTRDDAVIERYSTAYARKGFAVNKNKDNGYIVEQGFEYKIPTASGDCGSILMVGPSVTHTQGRKIIGFHTGGIITMGVGLSNAVSLEMVEEALKKFDEIREKVELSEIVGQADKFVVEGSFMPLYEVARPVSSPPYTKLSPTCLYNAWKQNERFPAHLREFEDVDGNKIKPMVVALGKYNTPVRIYDQDFVSQCAHVAYSKIYYETKHIFERSVVSFEEAVKGIDDEDFARGLPRGTSSGYPYSVYGAKGKKDFFGDDEEYDLTNPMALKLKDHCEYIESEARKGVRLLHVYNDFLKDERRTEAKNTKGETRLVSGAPLAYVIVFRRYFLRFMSAVMKTRVKNGTAAGVNPYTDWKYLRDHLLENAENCVAGDYSAFDSSEQPQIHETILDFINKWYDDGAENARVRSVLWRDLTHSRHIGGDGNQNNIIYQWYHALPSGHPGTTIVNSMYNLCMFTMCWAKIMGTHRLRDYHDNVRIVVLGDDNLLTIKDSCVAQFNQHTITEAMALFHMKYTSETKGDQVEPFRKISEVTFLKRGFHEEGGYVYGPLALETIIEMPYWCRDKKRRDEIVQTNFETALMELSAHPQEVWDFWSKKMYPAYKDRTGRDTILRPVRNDYRVVYEHQVNIY